MGPLYTHCPHCSFPAVVGEADRFRTRRCRQCRAQYQPVIDDGADASGLADSGVRKPSRRDAARHHVRRHVRAAFKPSSNE